MSSHVNGAFKFLEITTLDGSKVVKTDNMKMHSDAFFMISPPFIYSIAINLNNKSHKNRLTLYNKCSRFSIEKAY
ncbi:hypothetical protein CFB3_44400 [Clostridium folliculivorans]|uniref:Uncharacterized protein n=1 Tax=Clostridium folliculivorans TaxID=2886038 RepID=A0A9W6DCZ2_9CLOT|nr:hypothetical protein CFOLD11_43090 [Clostridium folliculivorans]GKU32332.1 hypothetical protein CFB3_44400 [Clostridium folliculivorans]